MVGLQDDCDVWNLLFGYFCWIDLLGIQFSGRILEYWDWMSFLFVFEFLKGFDFDSEFWVI